MTTKAFLIFCLVIAAMWAGATSATAGDSRAVKISGSHALGRSDAPVTLVEFADYDCFYCRRHKAQIEPLIFEAYVKTGKLRYVVREYPPKDPKSPAFRATEAAFCAADQGKYWEMRTFLYDIQKKFAEEKVIAEAGRLGMDRGKLESCLNGHAHRDRAAARYEEGKVLGVNRIPTFLLGLTDPANPNRFEAEAEIVGSKRFANFQLEIDLLLSKARQARTAKPRK